MADKVVPDGWRYSEVGCKSHFFDSGAFYQWSQAEKYERETGKSRWDYYETQAFWDYLDAYADFVKEHSIGIDLYANVDAIPNPELTWRNQQYLEKKHGLKPVPVVHYKSDLKWLTHYIDLGYPIIGLGGLVGSLTQDHCRGWLDRCFELVCDLPSRLPKVKIHGFGVTDFELIWRFPFFSVDSTSWTKIGGFGCILIPPKRKGEFVFDEQPILMKVSMDNPDRKLFGRHVLTMSGAEKGIVKEWLDAIGIEMGELDKDGSIREWGVITHHTWRRAANLLYYEHLLRKLPAYPWAFRSTRKKGFNIVH